MSTKNPTNQEEKEQTTEQHDSHVRTVNMSVETSSNRKRKQGTTGQCDHRLANAQENDQRKREEETLLINMIVD